MDNNDAFRTMVGTVLAISAAIGSNLGVNVQKKSHMNAETQGGGVYYKQPLWWLGMFLVIGGSVGDLLALGFAPQTLVASLGGGSTIFANVFFAHWWLKQPLYRTDIQGVVLVTIGVVLCAAASQPEGHFTSVELWTLWLEPAFIFYLIIVIGFVSLLSLRIKRIAEYGNRSKGEGELEASSRNIAAQVSSPDEKFEDVDLRGSTQDGRKRIGGLKKGGGEERANFWKGTPAADVWNHIEKLAVLKPGRPEEMIQEERRLPLYYAALSGTLGAQSVLLAKCVMELTVTTIRGDNQFKFFGTYVFLVGCVCCLLSQTHALNLATMHGDTMSTFPVFQAFWIGVSNVNAIVYFQQAGSFSIMQWILFPTALTVAIYGIYLISLHEQMGDGSNSGVMYSVVLEGQPGGFSALESHDSDSLSIQQHVVDEDIPQSLIKGKASAHDLKKLNGAGGERERGGESRSPVSKDTTSKETHSIGIDDEIDAILDKLDPKDPVEEGEKGLSLFPAKFEVSLPSSSSKAGKKWGEEEEDVAAMINEVLKEKTTSPSSSLPRRKDSATVMPFPSLRPPPSSSTSSSKPQPAQRESVSTASGAFVIDSEGDFV